MEEIKAPKKERKFLKAVGNIAKVLANELVMGIARKFIGKAIDKVGNKKQGLSIVLIILASSFAFAQYPTTGNKQRLGFQTTGDGLVWRGSLSDTASIQPTNNQNAWVIIDTVNLKLYSFDFTSNVWNLVGGAAGLTMPFDSITFNTAKDGTVGIGEVEYNDTQGSLIQGLKGGNVTNVIGQQLHQRVNNRTGSTLTKGTAVYLSGSQENRITVAKALGVTDAFSANTFGIVAESISNNQSGYVITEGLITNINTSALTEDSAVYLSPTVAGGLTSTKPQAPQHTVYIGVCVKSNAGSGELFVKIRNGQELDELHDVRITSPVDKASLYYKSSEGLWRDTTAALLVSDTASMLSNYATKAYADTTGRLYARQDYTTGVTTSTLTWTQSDTLIPGGVTFVQVYRNGQILLPSQYTIPTSTSIVIAASSFKVGENYTVIFPRGGGAGSGGGSGSLTSISAGTGITVSPNPITTTGTVSADLSVLMELTDTTLLNLTSRFASKLNTTDTASLSNRIDAKGDGTVTSVATAYGLTGGTITTTGTLRVDSNTVYNYVRDSIVKVRIGNDTIKILKQEYNNVTSDTLIWTTTVKFPIQLRAYILLFRNGQLLINDQFSIIDTNKIKLAASSYKLGENYTLVTVSGIGSAGVSQTGNPIYPEAGIALSTGTTWTTSITNNSTNWNTAYTDRLKWDGGSTGLVAATGRTSLGGTTIGQSMFTLTNPSAITFPRFNADNTVTALSAALFRSAISAGTVTEVDASATAGNPISITDKTTTPKIELLSATSGRNGYLTSTDWTTFNAKQTALSNASSTVSGILTSTDWTTFNNKQNALTFTTPLINTSNTITINQASGSANGFLSSTDWTTFNNKFSFADTTQLNLTSRFAAKQNTLNSGTNIKTVNGTTLLGSGNLAVGTLVANDTVSLSNRINSKLNSSDTVSLSNRINLKFNTADTTQLNLTSRFAAKQNNITLTTTGTSGASSFDGTTLNIPNYTSSGGGTGTVTSVGLTAPSIFNVSGSPVTTNGTLALTYSGTALPLANGGTGATTADAALTNFGATAMGKSLFGLTNSVSDKFIKVNTDNTITLLNTADTRTAIGAGTGTVTSVSSGSGSISVATGTTTPVITIADAGLANSGVMTAGDQQFQGEKRFFGIVQFIDYARFNSTAYAATRIAGLSSTNRLSDVTLGAGLSLSGGVLSATSGGVTSVTASIPLSSTGGATPNITITDAGTGASGVVNTTTQSFAGNKTFTGTLNVSSTGTFGGRVKTNWLERNYAYSTNSSFTVSVNTTWQDINTNVLTTLTLPSASTYPGKELHLRQSGTGQIISFSSNVIPFTSPPTNSAGTAILNPTNNKAVTLVSDGTNWIIMQRSGN